MQLTGTTDKERIESAIAFAKAHRRHAYNHDKIAEVYRKAGVPFTDAADAFFREWYGVFTGISLYPNHTNISYDGGFHALIEIDFCFFLIDDEDELKDWYEPGAYPDYDVFDDGFSWPDIPGMIRAKYGADTVPVARGGFYYPSTVYIRPDGMLIIILPDNGYDTEQFFDHLDEFICLQLNREGARRIEKVLESQKLEGTLEERITAAIEFAKSHGGFQSCRLFDDYQNAFLNISKLTSSEAPEDADLAALLYQIIKEHPPVSWRSDIMPGKIEFVQE